jgi:hypothetical protein
MRNLYLCITAILGTAGLILGLTALIPQGMWIYLGAVVWGTATVTLSLASLKGAA